LILVGIVTQECPGTVTDWYFTAGHRQQLPQANLCIIVSTQQYE